MYVLYKCIFIYVYIKFLLIKPKMLYAAKS